jgi:hypothetical protein
MIPLSVDSTTATISQYAMDTFEGVDFSDIIPIIIALGAVEESRVPNYYWAVESQ